MLNRKILHLRSSRTLAGPERHLLELLPRLGEHGFEVEVAVLYRRRPGDPAEHPLLGRLAAAGISALQIEDPDRPGLAARRALAARLASGDIAALHGHDPKADWVLSGAVRAGGRVRAGESIRRLATLHLHTRATLPLRLYRKLDLRLLRRFAGVIAVSPALAAEFVQGARRVGGPKVGIVANGIDGAGLRARAEAGLPAVRTERAQFASAGGAVGSASAPLLVAAGRLARQKGFDLLLEALPAVLAVHPGVLLWIAGDGPEGPALSAQRDRLGLQGCVRFLGERDDLAAVFAAADGFVLPSRSEGSPYVLLEAMALGVPVVAAAVGGVSGMLGSAAQAALVAPGDSGALAGAILRLLQFPEGARQRAESGAGVRRRPAFGFPHGGRYRRLLCRDSAVRGLECGW